MNPANVNQDVVAQQLAKVDQWAAGDQQETPVNAKFKLPDALLAAENSATELSNLANRDREAALALADRKIAEYADGKTPLDKARLDAWTQFKVGIETEGIGAPNARMTQKEFLMWLLGKGKEEDHRRTPWGRDPRLLDLPGVREWIDNWVELRWETVESLKKLIRNGPGDLNEAFLYWKYILHFDWVQANEKLLLIDLPRAIEGGTMGGSATEPIIAMKKSSTTVVDAYGNVIRVFRTPGDVFDPKALGKRDPEVKIETVAEKLLAFETIHAEGGGQKPLAKPGEHKAGEELQQKVVAVIEARKPAIFDDDAQEVDLFKAPPTITTPDNVWEEAAAMAGVEVKGDKEDHRIAVIEYLKDPVKALGMKNKIGDLITAYNKMNTELEEKLANTGRYNPTRMFIAGPDYYTPEVLIQLQNNATLLETAENGLRENVGIQEVEVAIAMLALRQSSDAIRRGRELVGFEFDAINNIAPEGQKLTGADAQRARTTLQAAGALRQIAQLAGQVSVENIGMVKTIADSALHKMLDHIPPASIGMLEDRLGYRLADAIFEPELVEEIQKILHEAIWKDPRLASLSSTLAAKEQNRFLKDIAAVGTSAEILSSITYPEAAEDYARAEKALSGVLGQNLMSQLNALPENEYHKIFLSYLAKNQPALLAQDAQRRTYNPETWDVFRNYADKLKDAWNHSLGFEVDGTDERVIFRRGKRVLMWITKGALMIPYSALALFVARLWGGLASEMTSQATASSQSPADTFALNAAMAGSAFVYPAANIWNTLARADNRDQRSRYKLDVETASNAGQALSKSLKRTRREEMSARNAKMKGIGRGLKRSKRWIELRQAAEHKRNQQIIAQGQTPFVNYEQAMLMQRQLMASQTQIQQVQQGAMARAAGAVVGGAVTVAGAVATGGVSMAATAAAGTQGAGLGADMAEGISNAFFQQKNEETLRKQREIDNNIAMRKMFEPAFGDAIANPLFNLMHVVGSTWGVKEDEVKKNKIEEAAEFIHAYELTYDEALQRRDALPRGTFHDIAIQQLLKNPDQIDYSKAIGSRVISGYDPKSTLVSTAEQIRTIEETKQRVSELESKFYDIAHPPLEEKSLLGRAAGYFVSSNPDRAFGKGPSIQDQWLEYAKKNPQGAAAAVVGGGYADDLVNTIENERSSTRAASDKANAALRKEHERARALRLEIDADVRKRKLENLRRPYIEGIPKGAPTPFSGMAGTIHQLYEDHSGVVNGLYAAHEISRLVGGPTIDTLRRGAINKLDEWMNADKLPTAALARVQRSEKWDLTPSYTEQLELDRIRSSFTLPAKQFVPKEGKPVRLAPATRSMVPRAPRAADGLKAFGKKKKVPPKRGDPPERGEGAKRVPRPGGESEVVEETVPEKGAEVRTPAEMRAARKNRKGRKRKVSRQLSDDE